MSNPTLVLDLDGTLVDSSLDLIPSLNRTTQTEGLSPVQTSDIGHLVGMGVKPMLRKAYAINGRDIDDETLEIGRAHV